jgi:hypothetical protein
MKKSDTGLFNQGRIVWPQIKRGETDIDKTRSAEGNDPPINFPNCDFKPGHAWWRTTVGSGDATRIQTSASFISWHVRMPVQNDIDIVGQLIGRNVLKTEFQSTADKIDDQRPFKIAIAITAHNGYSRADRAKLIENAFRANISKMPDFACIFSQFLHLLRQAIVCVRQDENAQRLLFRSFLVRHG